MHIFDARDQDETIGFEGLRISSRLGQTEKVVLTHTIDFAAVWFSVFDFGTADGFVAKI